MLSQVEFDKIVNHAKDNKLKRDQVFEYIADNFVTKTAFGQSARDTSCVRPIKEQVDKIIGHDLDGNPIIDSQRKRERTSGFKVRTRGESSRSDPIK